MPARAFRCPECRRSLGLFERAYKRNGKQLDSLRLGRNVVGTRRRLFAGRWAECVCGHETRLPADVQVIDPPEI